MSRNFGIFLIVLCVALICATALRFALFTYDGLVVYVFDRDIDELTERRRVVYRGWYQRFNDSLPYESRPNLRVYLVPILYPEISFRYPNATRSLSGGGQRATRLRAAVQTVAVGPFDAFLLRTTPGMPGEVVFYDHGKASPAVRVPWALIDPAAPPPWE